MPILNCMTSISLLRLLPFVCLFLFFCDEQICDEQKHVKSKISSQQICDEPDLCCKLSCDERHMPNKKLRQTKLVMKVPV